MGNDNSVEKGKYCVYIHSHNGEVFYVGKGTSTRPYSKVGRTKTWVDYVNKIGTYTVEIILWTDDEYHALSEEFSLIKSLKPSCNIRINEPCKESISMDISSKHPGSLGSRIKMLRLAVGLSQYELAQRAGIHRETLQRIESNAQVTVRLDVARYIAMGMGINLEMLVHSVDLKPPRYKPIPGFKSRSYGKRKAET